MHTDVHLTWKEQITVISNKKIFVLFLNICLNTLLSRTSLPTLGVYLEYFRFQTPQMNWLLLEKPRNTWKYAYSQCNPLKSQHP